MGDKVAFGGCCSHILRGQRESIYDSNEDKKESEFDAYYNAMERQQRNILDILSKLHSMMGHTKTIKNELNEQKENDQNVVMQSRRFRERAKTGKNAENDHNKFVTEIEAKSHLNVYDLFDLLTKHGLNRNDILRFVNYLKANKFDATSIQNDLFNESQSYLFEAVEIGINEMPNNEMKKLEIGSYARLKLLNDFDLNGQRVQIIEYLEAKNLYKVQIKNKKFLVDEYRLQRILDNLKNNEEKKENFKFLEF